MVKRSKQRVPKGILGLLLGTILVGIGLFFYFGKEPIQTIQASSVVSTGDFRLTAKNSWDNSAKRSYVDMKWDKIANLSQSGYKLYQSENGSDWNIRSTTYGKSIKVLNVYPDSAASNTLKGWMDGLNLKGTDGSNLIQVTPVAITTFNGAADSYLKNSAGEYQYDVIMFGSWDSNNNKNISVAAAEATTRFLSSGRGVLFGHDTVVSKTESKNFWTYFHDKKDYLGIGHEKAMEGSNGIVTSNYWTGSQKVKVINDGYLMKYPFEMANGLVLTIPYAHNIELSNKNVGTVWSEFIEPSGGYPNQPYDAGIWRGGWYLKTNDNAAMIQTGHSGGQSTQDERKIIANVLYNLAQVSLESNATDYSVTDDQGPAKPKVTARNSNGKDLSLQVEATDKGKDYQFYVDADTKDRGVLQSDIVKETVTSNVAGYFFELSDSPNSTLTDRVDGLKDEFGRIDPSKYDLYVAPDSDATDYNTSGSKIVSANNVIGKYLHVVAVDRANNIGEIASQPVRDLTRPMGFGLERTGDEAKIVDLTMDAATIDNRMKSIEIQIPKNSEIKDFNALQLPTGWFSFENSETDSYYSFSFAMETNNSLATIQSFLESLRFTLKNNVNDPGRINIIFHEKIYTSWIDPNGANHYYVFMPEMSLPGKNWFQAYNSAKQLRYKQLTGYLATITSLEEHDFVFNNISKEPGWLGGTRGVVKTGNRKINDEATVPQNVSDYNLTLKDWYWADGPEAGQVFYNGITYSGGKTPAGAYSAFNSKEPNNSGGSEFTLQFAQSNSKYWNDLPGDLGFWASNHGYYVEFSEYGDQKEGIEETDIGWTAEMPQKITLQAYEERGTRLPYGDLVYDQQLRLEKGITAEPKDIDLYKFVELRDMTDTPRDMNYIVGPQHQEGKLIYTSRGAKLHVRQVILDANDEIPVPKEGYLKIRNQQFNNNSPTLDTEYQNNRILSSGKQEDNPNFTEVIFSTVHQKDGQDASLFELTVPAYYQYEGYHLTTQQQDPNGASHQANTVVTPSVPAISRDSFYTDQEQWLTLYVRSTKRDGDTPEVYSWDYERNKFDKVHTILPS